MSDNIKQADAPSVAIKVENLTKTFKGKQVLNIDELTVNRGDMVALLGPSGSGKSTLLRLLSGLMTGDPTSESRIIIDDEIIQQKGRLGSKIRKKRCQIGLIFQQFNLVNRLTTIENVLVGALGHTPLWRTFFKCFTQEQKRKAIAALRRVGMDSYAYQRVSTLSGGQQQRVAIARALMQGAEVVLADEPIASLDPESSKVVMTILRDICRENGLTLVVTLHQVEHALNYCEQVIALQNGHIFYQGSSARLTEKDLELLYRIEREDSPNDSGITNHLEIDTKALIETQAKIYA